MVYNNDLRKQLSRGRSEMSYYESFKRTQDAIDESINGKPKPKKAAVKKPAKKKEIQQQYFDRLRKEAIERAKAAR